VPSVSVMAKTVFSLIGRRNIILRELFTTRMCCAEEANDNVEAVMCSYFEWNMAALALRRFALPGVPRGYDGTNAASTSSFFSCLLHDTMAQTLLVLPLSFLVYFTTLPTAGILDEI
jgi:hypothetical protein